MKKWFKKFLMIFISPLMAFSFAACNSNTNNGCALVENNYLCGTDMSLKGATEGDIEGIGKVFFLNVKNVQLILKFDDYVQVNPQSTWTVSTDLSGIDIIPSRTVQLDVGDNPLFYIHVVDKSQQHNTYIVLIHRNYLFQVIFNSNGGSSCDPINIEEGEILSEVPVSSKVGYTFDGWDYDFSKPIRENVVANARWTANQYTITFNLNGGTGLSSTTLVVTYGRSFVLPVPRRTGYRFDGWYNVSTKITDGVWRYTSNMTLIARWEIITYSIFYYLNGGSAANISLQNTYTVEDELVIPSPTRVGYQFQGWSTSSSASAGIIDYKINKGTTGTISLYACWLENSYTITYDVNGGDSLENDTQTVYYDSHYSLATPTRLGYTFDGWYIGDDKITDGIWTFDGNATLVAHWTLNIYDINYHFNGGSVNVSLPSTYTVNDLGKENLDNTILNSNPTKTGYMFDGFFENEQFTKPYVRFKEQTYVGNKDIYFKWNPNKYLITFDVNGGNSLESNTLEVTYDNYYYLPTPTRDGYEFVGWYLNTQLFENGIWTRLDDITLVAKWSLKTYSINYFLDGGINNSNNPNNFTYEDETIVLQDPYKKGYTFLGWSFDQNGTPIRNIEIAKNTHHNISVYAFWNVNTYHVSFDVNGGKELSQNEYDVTYDSIFNLPEVSRDGYEFVGWYEGLTKYESGSWITDRDVVLIAQWVAINYSITYELDGGTNHPDNPNFYTYDSGDIVLQDPTKTGYTFLGWTSLNISTPTKNVCISNHSMGDLTFTANWKINEYIITYDVNGGEPLDSNTQRVTYHDDFILKTPTRSGYEFVGWFNGNTRFQSGYWTYLEDITLVARWRTIQYSITYLLNGGTNNYANPSYFNCETEDIVLQDPTKVGYTFDGWFDLNNNQVFVISQGTIGDVSLTAKWSPNLNSLSISANDYSRGTVELLNGIGYSDELITIQATPFEPYIFMGWYNGQIKVSGNAKYTFSMPTNNYSLEAKFLTNSEYQINQGLRPTVSNGAYFYGRYPQTNIDDCEVLEDLNSLTSTTINGWYLYNNEYYCKTIAGTSNNTLNNGVKPVKGQAYWFKCEPIQWYAKKNETNAKVLWSYYLLDAQKYYRNLDYRTIDGETVCPSNYYHSDLRAWFNGTFYWTAFYNNDIFLPTWHVNNFLSTGSNYSSESSDDYVFALSEFELAATSSTYIQMTKKKTMTDYCIIQTSIDGIARPNHNKYWTRTPAVYGSSASKAVIFYDESGTRSAAYANDLLCVCPSILFNLDLLN